MNTPTQIKSATPARHPVTDYRDMVGRAVEQGATMEVLEKLLALQERWEANQARRAFEEAITAAKAHMPIIAKNRTVSYGGAGKTSYKHEDLAEIARTVDPVLGEHGLSYRFRTNQIDGRVSVTCIVSHRDGHSEENTLSSGYDTSGSKNPIQAIGSAVTYLQRYALKAALGLAASDEDDGQAVVPATKVPATTLPKKDARDIYAKLQADIAAAKSRPALRAWMAANVDRIKVMPEDWQDILRLRCEEMMADLRQQEGNAPAAHDEDGVIQDDVALFEHGITPPGNVVLEDEPLADDGIPPVLRRNGDGKTGHPAQGARNETLWLQLFESNMVACKTPEEIGALTSAIPGDLSVETLTKARKLTVTHLARVAGSAR